MENAVDVVKQIDWGEGFGGAFAAVAERSRSAVVFEFEGDLSCDGGNDFGVKVGTSPPGPLSITWRGGEEYLSLSNPALSLPSPHCGEGLGVRPNMSVGSDSE